MKSKWFPVTLFMLIAIVIASDAISSHKERKEEIAALDGVPVDQKIPWCGWNQYQIPTDGDSARLIRYGYELIANTSRYLGPKGTVARVTNGMNCQNCHLEGGILPFGNNFGSVYADYPMYRPRNDQVQTIYGRINGCFQRSINGKPLDSTSREMKALYAYMKWLGEGVPRGTKPFGTGLMKLKFLDRAADPAAGEKVFVNNCQSCHGSDGQGQLNPEGTAYVYPPLWGPHSYNDGAGLYRLGNFAGFVKNNMPFGTNYLHPKLTDEEAWDVAAYVNSRPRPHKDQHADWKELSKKPIDFPFGPYADRFSEQQHKYGPFGPVRDFYKKKKQ